jgi:hypothetical protein
MIFASMTSSGTTGMASRCATVPCALANQRDHGEHGQTTVDLHDGVDPAWRHVGAPDDQIDRCFAGQGRGGVAAARLPSRLALKVVASCMRMLWI